MPDAVEAAVVAIIAKKKKLPPERITPEAAFADLGIDSLDAMDIVFALEDEFHIDITDEAVQAIKTVGDATAALRQAIAVRAAEGA